MKKLLQAFVMLLFVQQATAFDTNMPLLLSMKYITNDHVYDEASEYEQVDHVINVYGTEVNPNHRASNSQFKVTVDGVEVDSISSETFGRLQQLRRNFSDDSVSGGIQRLTPSAVLCRLGGPARGLRLEALYLTFENHQVTESNMKRVLDLPLNCLYQPQFVPLGVDGKESAISVMAVLRTIVEMQIH
ncbi:hypothetical protein [uncultured Endozoicomonas sp.]|uniref:hypothetical protein n=1 Tax=uncultured Endozoicomonas sp. TaxID=432652 RepID=UPI00261C09DA|nr:hypothetical protein [uncultured Endozoicomonas sp.]